LAILDNFSATFSNLSSASGRIPEQYNGDGQKQISMPQAGFEPTIPVFEQLHNVRNIIYHHGAV
jgi:hypothetical protein